MDAIAHSVPGCPECRAPIDGANVWHEPDCPRRDDEALKVEVVRAIDYRGAVSLLDDLADALAEVQRGELAVDDARVNDVLRRSVEHRQWGGR
jgi:hypothetical protein